MNTTNESRTAIPSLAKAWAAVQVHALLRPIRNDADFQRVHALANDLSDEVGDDEDHPLFSLLEIVQDLMQRWEDEHVEIPNSEPKELLRYLLEDNDLKQKDLADIISPTLMSDILSGRRKISREVAKSLGARFHLEPGIFL